MAQQRNKRDYEKIGIKIPANHLKASTQKAHGFDPTDSKEGSSSLIWVPISQITDWQKDDKAGLIFFAIPRWLFEQNDRLEDFHDEDYVDFEAI